MKKEYFMLAVVIAVLCAYLVLHKKNKTHYTTPDVPAVRINDIAKIKIVKGKKDILLEKNDDNWLVTKKKYPADKIKVKAMLNVIAKLSLSDLISQGGDLTRYELDPEHRIKIIAENDSGNILRKFFIGKTAPTFRHTFVTMNDDKDVYYANGNFRSDFDNDINDFRDKTVLSFKEDTIQQIKIEKGKNKKEFFLKKSMTPENKIAAAKSAKNSDKTKNRLNTVNAESKTVKKWESKDNSDFNVSDVKDLLSELADLTCSSYTDNDSKDAYKSKTPLCVIHIRGKKNIGNKENMVISIYSKNKNGDYPGICSENRYPFILGSYDGNNILSKVNTLLGLKKNSKKKAGKAEK